MKNCSNCGTIYDETKGGCPACGAPNPAYSNRNARGFAQPNQNTQGFAQPNPNAQGFNQPNPNMQGFNQPNPNMQGFNQPNPNMQGFNQPNPNMQGFNPQYGPQFSQYPMKWYKFLIYFSLFAAAVGYVIMAILYFTGGIYSDSSAYGVSGADLVYSVFPSMKTINILYGLALLALAAYSVFVRFQLSGYKTTAPKNLLSLYIVSSALTVIYDSSVMAVLSGVPDSSSIVGDVTGEIIGAIIGSIVMVALNNIYFKKRASLFVN